MKLLQDCWTSFLELFSALTLSPSFGPSNAQQQVLPGGVGVVRPHYGGNGPIFTPPSRPQDPGEVLKCDYSAMGQGWQPCSTSKDRSCWLAGPGGKRFDIKTDYETEAPVGTTRRVSIRE